MLTKKTRLQEKCDFIRSLILWFLIALLIGLTCYIWARFIHPASEPVVSEMTSVSTEPVQVWLLRDDKSKFDMSALEAWCGSPVGKIRMMGAWVNPNDSTVLLTEDGNSWQFDHKMDSAFYLIWFDDMGTEDVLDDEILKIWKEV